MSDSIITLNVEAILNCKNPVIIFEDTYAVHRELVKLGVLVEGRLPGSLAKARYPSKSFEYRVDHGNGYLTQNTWYMHDVVPHIEDLPRVEINKEVERVL